MKVFAPALLAALVAFTAVVQSTAQKDERFGARISRRDSTYDLEPPRPGGFGFFSDSPSSQSASQSKVSEDTSFFPSEHFLSSFTLTTTPSPVKDSKKLSTHGKSQHFSEVKKVPSYKPIYEGQASEKKETKKDTKKENDNIQCVKIDKKAITADDVFKGRFKRDASMVCYKCEDLKNGGSYEKCSYGSDPKNKAFFVSHQKSYSSNDKPVTFKYGSDRDETRDIPVVHHDYKNGPSADYLASAASIGQDYKYEGPSYSSSNNNEYKYGGPSYSSSDSKYNYSPSSRYDSGKDSSHDYSSKPSEYSFSSSKKDTPSSYSRHTTDAPVSYSYSTKKEAGSDDPETKYESYLPKSTQYSYKTTKVEPTKSYSYQSTDPPSSYSYQTESSSAPKHSPEESNDKYTSKPTEYSYSTSKNEPPQSYSYESTDKPVSYSYRNGKEVAPKYESHATQPKASEYSFSKSIEDPLKTYHVSSSYDNDQPQQNKQSENDKYSPSEYSYSQSSTEPEKTYHQSSSYNSDDNKPKKPNQQQIQQHVPQVKEYSSSSSYAIPETFIAEPSDELRKALGEFNQKDRSNCKKIQKEKMTCWQCVDKSGAQQEECMYVASSEPKKHQTAYSDVKEYTSKPQSRRQAIEKRSDTVIQPQHSDIKEVSSPRPVRRRTSSGTTPEPSAAPSTISRRGSHRREARPSAATEQPVRSSRRGEEREREPSPSSNKRRTEPNRRRSTNPDDEQKKSEAPSAPNTKEFQPEGPHGAYSEETIERFDPVRGVSLPEYMLSRSIQEQQFDEAVRTGR